MNDRNTLYDSEVDEGRYDGAELMGRTGYDQSEDDRHVRQIMEPSSSGHRAGDRPRPFAAPTGPSESTGHLAETGSYHTEPGAHPGGTREGVGGEIPRQTGVGPAPTTHGGHPPPPSQHSQPGGEDHTRMQDVQQRQQPRQQEQMRTRQQVDRVPGKKPSFLESIRANIMPVAFVGVGIGLLINQNRAGSGEKEIRTTVRVPENEIRTGNPTRPDEGYSSDTSTAQAQHNQTDVKAARHNPHSVRQDL